MNLKFPEIKELVELATELRGNPKPQVRFFRGFACFYWPRVQINYSTEEVDPFTLESSNLQRKRTETPSHFICGYGSDTRIEIGWSTPSDSAPSIVAVTPNGHRDITANTRGVVDADGTDMLF